MSSFIQQCLNGNVLLEDIDDFIHQWHNTDSGVGIYDYLGMTRREYFLWVRESRYTTTYRKRSSIWL